MGTIKTDKLGVLRGKEMNERSGFTSMVAIVKIDADLSEEEKKEFIREVDRRCPISENLIHSTPIEIKISG